MELSKIFPGWEAAEYIGEGSFGKVYKITREDFGHIYESALKVITIPANKGELASVLNDGFDEESATMYFRGMVEDIVEEFVLMSKLRGNSNIVSYEDHAVIPHEGNIGWDIYIRMELLKPLFTHIKEHSLSIRDVISLGIDMCQALEVCQKYNIIHRDIKPENIFVSNLGHYKLGDFGIARQLEKTSSGLSKKGTYSYMAPEVYKGEEYNSTVDIYSLGIVLYRFLNQNRTPFLPPYPEPIRFSDKDKANILRFSGEKMKPPCHAKGRLAEIILKACAYHPKERYESARDMREALQGILYSEKEKELVYPTGDELSCEANEYAFSAGNAGVKDVSEKSAHKSEGSIHDGTIHMFQLEDSGQEENEAEKTTGLFVNAREQAEKYQDIETAEEKVKEMEAAETENTEQEHSEENEHTKHTGKETENPEPKDQSPAKREKNAASQKKHLKSGIIAAAAIAGMVCICLVFSMARKNSKTEIPDFTHMTLQEAKAAASEYGLTILQAKESYSDTVEEGKILSQNLQAGISVKKESTVEVEISLGKKASEVPEVTGLTEEEARQVLEQAGFACKTGDFAYSDSVEEGRIISQSPEAGTAVKEQTDVILTLSKGAEPVIVPDVVGMTEQEAKDALKGAGLKVKASEEEDYNDAVEAGRVTGQDIGSGEAVAPKTKVNISISKGAAPKEEQASEQAVQKQTSSKPQTVQQQPAQQQPQQPAQPQPQEQPQPQPQEQPQQQAPEESIDSWDLVN